MAGSQSVRRSQETGGSSSTRPDGPPPSYRHSQILSSTAAAGISSPLPPTTTASSTDHAADSRSTQAAGERDAASGDLEKTFKELTTKYKNVKRLYFDGKSQIEQLNGQVEQLQNAIASQRMSQSRTALDDNGYITRFGRLNGAINNLSFNIRKDWKSLPAWIEAYASPEALKTGKQEMTAIGRAVITRWLVEAVFNRCFHPNLDPELSQHLKAIEQNIRHFSYNSNSQEEFGAHIDKVINWRMTTLEGLQSVLQGHEINQNGIEFARNATDALVEYLCQYLADPPPAGMQGSASSIVDLAVGIASNIPMESRDVVISYPMPLENIVPHLMDVEKAGWPALEPRPADDGADPDDNDDSSAEGKDDDKSRTRANPSGDFPKVRYAGFVAVEVRGRQVLNKASVWAL